MKLENGWLQEAYTTHRSDDDGDQISEQKSQILKIQFVSCAARYAKQAREACFLTTVNAPAREEA